MTVFWLIPLAWPIGQDAPQRTLRPEASRGLAARLQPLIHRHRGEVAVAIEHLHTGEFFFHRETAVMPTASLIKFPIMVEAYLQARAGRLDLGEMVTLKAEDKVLGSGLLTPHFSAGASFSLRDAIRLMIAFSDNTATNLVIDRLGITATATTMEKLGYPETKLHSKVFRRETSAFPERSARYGLGSTTARDMVKLFAALERGQLVHADACREMLEHLRACDDKTKFLRYLPENTPLAFKTGSVDAARTAAGLMVTQSGTVVICVLTAQNQDRRWTRDNAGDQLCAQVAKEVYEHFHTTPRTPRAQPNSKSKIP